MTTSPSHSDIHALVRGFFADSVEALKEDLVLPVPRHARHIRVGTDYEGLSIMRLDSYADFYAEMTLRWPRRFDASEPHVPPEAPDNYIFPFLETCIADIGENARWEDLDMDAVDMRTDQLVQRLDTDRVELAAARLVTDMTTADGSPVTFGSIEVIPTSTGDIRDRISSAVPRWMAEARGRSRLAFRHSYSLVIKRAQETDTWSSAWRADGMVDHFLLVVRMLFNPTSQIALSVTGETSPIGSFPTRVAEGDVPDVAMIRREARLEPTHESAIAELGCLLLATTEEERGGPDVPGEPKYVATPIQMALSRFLASYSAEHWTTRIVDLATALEAAISGSSKTDIVHRLCSRVALLLQDEDDPGKSLFEDTKTLYDLRSMIVHGSELKINAVLKDMASLSTTPEKMEPNVIVEFGMDRFRDIVRRAILARICLARMEPSLWPSRDPSNRAAVDTHLSDDIDREQWRREWRGILQSLGAGWAAQRAPDAVDSLVGRS